MAQEVEDEKSNKSKKKEEKAYFVQRLVAFVIDFLIVSILSSLISTPFVDASKVSELENQQISIMEEFREGKMEAQDYFVAYSDAYYKLSRNTGLVTIITILIEVLYFVVFQTYTKGQTVGKILMKIRVISEDGDLFMNQMIFRSFIANFILLNIISFIFMLFSPKDLYFYIIIFLEAIQYLVIFISSMMILNHNNGLAIHDRLMHTKVVRVV